MCARCIGALNDQHSDRKWRRKLTHTLIHRSFSGPKRWRSNEWVNINDADSGKGASKHSSHRPAQVHDGVKDHGVQLSWWGVDKQAYGGNARRRNKVFLKHRIESHLSRRRLLRSTYSPGKRARKGRKAADMHDASYCLTTLPLLAPSSLRKGEQHSRRTQGGTGKGTELVVPPPCTSCRHRFQGAVRTNRILRIETYKEKVVLNG